MAYSTNLRPDSPIFTFETSFLSRDSGAKFGILNLMDLLRNNAKNACDHIVEGMDDNPTRSIDP